MIRSDAACGAGPPPCSTIVTISSPMSREAEYWLRSGRFLARSGIKFSSARWRFGRKIQSAPWLWQLSTTAADDGRSANGGCGPAARGELTGTVRGPVRELARIASRTPAAGPMFPIRPSETEKARLAVVSGRFAPICSRNQIVRITPDRQRTVAFTVCIWHRSAVDGERSPPSRMRV